MEILKIYIVFFQTLENTNLFSKEHRIHIYFGRENIQREIEEEPPPPTSPTKGGKKDAGKGILLQKEI